MTVKFKVYNDNNAVYQANFKQYVEDVQKYYEGPIDIEDEDEGPSDPELRRILGVEEDKNKREGFPIKPEPPMVYVTGKIRNELIQAYHVLPDQAGIRLLLDYGRVEQGTAIIKYDDKIIEELDSILD